jgi:predicted enzyme related to lactoylglutathione lyase
MPANPIVWFEIYVNDMPRAKAFYERVLNIKLQKLASPTDEVMEMWSFPADQKAPGATGALAKMQGGPSGGNTSTIIYFHCEDCALEASRVGPAGGKVMKEKFPIGPHGFIALATDTEGNAIGLHSMK